MGRCKLVKAGTPDAYRQTWPSYIREGSTKEHAARAAREMQRLSPRKSSGKYLEAEAIIANMNFEGEERVNKR